jgi:phage terminase Nu1 subunit (DNA packaging protein)
MTATQASIGIHLDLDQSSVSRLCKDLGIDHKTASLAEIRIAYIRHLREQAAGRATNGDLDLATERARLAKEQADRIAFQNAITRRELMPTIMLEDILAATGAKVAAILDGIPGAIRARNLAASMTLDQLESEAAAAASAAPVDEA